MSGEVVIEAPAKVNLHLQVLGRRADSYHDILSLFQAVSLADSLRIRTSGKPGSLRIRGSFGFPPQENIIARAVRIFLARTGISAGIDVAVEKRIPMAAGLGGGSSDAAATLRGLAALLGGGPTDGLVADIAAELGSDVPFFLGSAAALVESRGERLTPLQARTDFAIVAVLPDTGVSTAEAYRLLDEERPGSQLAEPSPDDLREAYARLAPERWRFSNSFDDVVCRAFPRISAAREALAAAGAPSPRLTGSGSTIIGVFPDSASAETCRARLARGGRDSLLLSPIATIPDVCYNRRMRIRRWEDTHGDYGHSHQEGRI